MSLRQEWTLITVGHSKKGNKQAADPHAPVFQPTHGWEYQIIINGAQRTDEQTLEITHKTPISTSQTGWTEKGEVLTYSESSIVRQTRVSIAVIALGEGWCVDLPDGSIFCQGKKFVLRRARGKHSSEGLPSTSRNGGRLSSVHSTRMRMRRFFHFWRKYWGNIKYDDGNISSGKGEKE